MWKNKKNNKGRNMIYDIFVKLQLGWHPVAVVHYTFTHKQYIEQHNQHKNTLNYTKIFGRVQAMLRLCELYPGICLTTEEKSQKNLRQGGRRVPPGTMKIYKHKIRIRRHNNKNA